MMADVVKIATRDSYGNAVTALAAEHDDILVLDADLAGATKTAIFKKAYPDRHINCGIAEADLIGVSAGLSTMGFVPFCSSFAMFAAGRAYEQVRNTVGYPHLNVKICATHGGISVGEDGASHQCCEDFALMRTIPGMVVLSPADDVEARAAVKAAYEHKGPVYIRFGRAAVPVIHEEENYYLRDRQSGGAPPRHGCRRCRDRSHGRRGAQGGGNARRGGHQCACHQRLLHQAARRGDHPCRRARVREDRHL